MTTIRQLAHIAGVSPSTVSRALHDDPRISPTVREQIQELAVTYHYAPYRSVVDAARGKTRTIGCLMTDVSMMFESRILRGILDAAYGELYQVTVWESLGNVLRAQQAINILVEQSVQGIILLSVHPEPIPRSSLLQIISSQIVPVAVDFTDVEMSIPCVSTDEDALAEIAVEHLYQLGHRCIGFIGPVGGNYRHARSQSVRRALQRRNLSLSYIQDWDAPHFRKFDATRALERQLSIVPHSTAIIGFDDHVAASIIHAAKQRGLAVPHDISIIGCSNLEIAEYNTPSLTSVDQYPEEMGRRACQYILQQLSENAVSKPQNESLTILPTLVIRNSCAPPKKVKGNVT